MKRILFLILTTGLIFGEDTEKYPPLEESVFSIKEGKVFMKDKLISTADASSFLVLNALCHGEEDKHCFGADKKRVYYYSQELPNSDPATFRFLSYGYSTDKNNVYYIMDNVFRTVREADSKTFQVLNGSANTSYAYARDKRFVYYDGLKIKGSHGKSCKLIFKEGKYDANDKFQYYKEGVSFSKKRKKL